MTHSENFNVAPYLWLCIPWKQSQITESLFPSDISGRGYNIGPVCVYVCLSVSLSVSALTAEPFDLRTQNLEQVCNLTTSRISLKVLKTVFLELGFFAKLYSVEMIS